MNFRSVAVQAVLAWFAAECWAAPWDPVFWPKVSRGILLGVFCLLVVLGIRARTRNLATDLAILSFAAALGASLAWSLWMWHGWFNWDWLRWLPSITGSDGEGSYRMIEYEFFLVLFFVATLAWGLLSKIGAERPRSGAT